MTLVGHQLSPSWVKWVPNLATILELAYLYAFLRPLFSGEVGEHLTITEDVPSVADCSGFLNFVVLHFEAPFCSLFTVITL